MSHALPDPVIEKLIPLAVALEEGLQAMSHKIESAMGLHGAFDETYIDSTLTRALVCWIARSGDQHGVRVTELSNGGCEAHITHDGIERLFRLKKATRDQWGMLNVTVSSDSLLTHRARAAELFDVDFTEPSVPVSGIEQWVLPYLINPGTHTLIEISAAMPVGVRNDKPPYRLVLDHVVRIPHGAPFPPGFIGREDDLAFPDEEEGGERTTA